MSSSRIRPATHTPRSSAPVAASLAFGAHTLRVHRAHGAAGFGTPCYRRRVRWLLVLWDIDFTLINAGGVGTRLYRMVLRDMFGTELPGAADMAGRTDRAIVLDTLARAGIPEPRKHLDQFLAKLAALAPTGHELAVQHSRALPGAAAALDALAAFSPGRDVVGRAGTGHGQDEETGPSRDGATDVRVVQSVLTGNVRRMAEIKLSAVGLDVNLDLDTGAYGDSHEIRSELVHLARGNAARKYGRGFAGTATVLVGDTPLDVAAARATGARAVAVATGGTSADKLAESGADAVLADLTDTPAVLAAILGGPYP
jgi:phosphoglycolate phosphatase